MCKLAALGTIWLLLAQYSWAQPGRLNQTFNGGAFAIPFNASSQAEDVAVQKDGKVLVAGVTLIGDVAHFALLRYNTDGTLDPSFGQGGKVSTLIGSECWAKAIAIQPDGKILLGGFAVLSSPDFALARYTADGSLDEDFGSAGSITTEVGGFTDQIKDLTIQSDGTIIAVGDVFNGGNFDIGIVRYSPSSTVISISSLDVAQADDLVNAVQLQSDGNILLTGVTYSQTDQAFVLLARYLAGGMVPDLSFGSGGKAITSVSGVEDIGKDITLQEDGKILVTGSTWNPPHFYDIFLLRYNADGSPDMSFGSAGKVITDIEGGADDAIGVFYGSDGKILVAGTAGGTLNSAFLLIRYKKNGELDPGFGNGGRALTDIGIFNNIAYGFAVSGVYAYVVGLVHQTSTGAPSDMAITAFVSDVDPLPVMIRQFSAEKQGNTILLQWLVEEQQNIEDYIVERSADGINFSFFEKVPAVESPSLNFRYTALDRQPLFPVSYYRLRVVEAQGSYSYSKIVAIKTNALRFEVFPNPVHSVSYLQIPAGLWGTLELHVMDEGGKTVRSASVYLSGNARSATVDLRGLPAGVYFVNAFRGEAVFRQRLIKL